MYRIIVMGALASLGCGASATARLVEATANGGEVALEGAYMERTGRAMVVMASHCDGDFAVVDDEGRLTDAPSSEQSRVKFVCTASIATAELAE